MKFFALTSLALVSSILSPVIAAPTPDNALAVRQTPADAPAALAIVSQLYSDVQQYTAVINSFDPNDSYPLDSTAASLSLTSSLEDKAAAGEAFTAAIASINTLVVEATSSIESLPDSPATKRALESITALSKRQIIGTDPTGLAGELVLILLEVGGALNNIIAILGLSK
ncbi:MAG: hypothetical protein Q9216_002981 [Gyalolechia sp. 2 TL-2023]